MIKIMRRVWIHCNGEFQIRGESARSRVTRRRSGLKNSNGLLRGASHLRRAGVENHHLLDGLHVSLHGVSMFIKVSNPPIWLVINFD
jgi:hypothetical protein